MPGSLQIFSLVDFEGFRPAQTNLAVFLKNLA